MDERKLLADWASAKRLVWMALYLASGLVLPWILTRVWAYKHGSKVRPNSKQLFQRGELGLMALVMAVSVIWDLQTSQYSAASIAVGSIFLTVGGIMAAAVWIESHCRQLSGIPDNPTRAWRDSFSLAFFVFSVATGAEVLLDRFTKVIHP